MNTPKTPTAEPLAPLTGSAFALRLREAREIARLTQEEAARRADMQPSAWSHMETGIRTPTIYNLAATCRAVRCSADWLLGLSTERPKARVVIVELARKCHRGNEKAHLPPGGGGGAQKEQSK